MKNENVIEVRNVSKQFRVYFDKGHSIKERLLFWKRNRFEWRSVLEDISFSVRQGEAVGLIGHNGCGKSTMLKLLTRIMYPNSGSITMKGRVSSLIELGAGFHPDMSGRENIYINASIFGLTRREIDERLEEIIAFSELGSYIDNPVRTYSSGMYMRLAFSVAINVDADILLVDEILAVGDANFQSKCFRKMRELKAKGVTIVIVTHDTGTVESFCDRAIWINKSRIAAIGPSQDTVSQYLSYMAAQQYAQAKEQEQPEDDVPAGEAPEMFGVPPTPDVDLDENGLYPMPASAYAEASHYGMMDMVVTNAYWINEKNEPTATLMAGKAAGIAVEYKVRKPVRDGVVFGVGIYTPDMHCIYGVNTQLDGITFDPASGSGRAICRFDRIDLISGGYVLQVAMVDRNNTPLDFYTRYSTFSVVSEERFIGVSQLAHTWDIQEVFNT